MESREEEYQALLDSLDPATRTLAAELDLGMQANEFIASDIGRYIIGCAQHEIAEANDALGRVSCWRRRKIQELQNKRWRAEQLLLWLRDLLVSAKSAKSALEERET